jgi:hypothetical protein
MDNPTRRSLDEILDYLHTDEERHWLEAGRPDTHIFQDIRKVEAWLDSLSHNDHSHELH